MPSTLLVILDIFYCVMFSDMTIDCSEALVRGNMDQMWLSCVVPSCCAVFGGFCLMISKKDGNDLFNDAPNAFLFMNMWNVCNSAPLFESC